MSDRLRRLLDRSAPWVIALGVLSCGCGTDAVRSPVAPGSPEIVSLAVVGLPPPLLAGTSPFLRAGEARPLVVQATLRDGSTTNLSPTVVSCSSSTETVVSCAGGTITPKSAGAAALIVRAGNAPAQSVAIEVYEPGVVVREERAERSVCGVSRPSYCVNAGPCWLFPVHASGQVELLAVVHPGWGSPSSFVTRLSYSGERLESFQLLDRQRSVAVPGGAMYVFAMEANLMPCDALASAAWTHY